MASKHPVRPARQTRVHGRRVSLGFRYRSGAYWRGTWHTRATVRLLACIASYWQLTSAADSWRELESTVAHVLLLCSHVTCTYRTNAFVEGPKIEAYMYILVYIIDRSLWWYVNSYVDWRPVCLSWKKRPRTRQRFDTSPPSCYDDVSRESSHILIPQWWHIDRSPS